MTSKELDNLVRIGLLKREPGEQKEFDGLLKTARAKLGDLAGAKLSAESEFDLAYNAVHALALAALRLHGYRPSENRYVVFQALPHTTGLAPALCRVFVKSHETRNVVEYQGATEIDGQLLAELKTNARALFVAVEKLGPVQKA